MVSNGSGAPASDGLHERERLVLASKSAARRAMLENAGVIFEVRTADVDEDAIKAVSQNLDAAALAVRLAEAKALDPATGRPDPKRQQAQKAQAAQAKALPLGTTRHTGESCPQSGIWHAQFPPHSISNRQPEYNVQRFFAQGSLLPPLPVHYPRLLGRWLGYPAQLEPVRWILMEYA